MAGDEAQSSSPVSSPQSIPDTIEVAPAKSTQRPRFLVPGDVVNNVNGLLPQSATKGVANNAKTATTSHDQPTQQSAPPQPTKRPRASKKKDAEGKADEKPKEKKPRKPRTVDPNKPTAAARKKQKLNDVGAAPEPTLSRQPTINEMVNNFQAPLQPAPATQQLHPAQILREDLSARPASSGQRYDPIRSAMTADPYTVARPPQVSPQPHRASASPAIASLMNPTSSNTMQSPVVLQSIQTPLKRLSMNSVPSPEIPTKPFIPLEPEAKIPAPMATNSLHKIPPLSDGPMKMEVDPPVVPQVKERVKEKSTEHEKEKEREKEREKEKEKENDKEKEKEKLANKSAPAASKAKRPTPPPARPTGSGLLSNSDLFGGPAMGEDDRTRHGVDIDIHIALDPAGNNTINIAQEIMKKYGRNAINPRAAAHRERLLQVANMGARLENGSADDMSVDLNSDAENDSNVEMGGMDDEKREDTGEDGKPKRRRRKKVEEYDKDDDFIDDTELAWQEGAAVAKDGFFVYSGPLIPVGEEAKIETSQPSGRGRGRGRGRSRAAAAGAIGVTHAQLAAKNESSGAAATSASGGAAGSSGRGRGRGRGTGAPRKPRITKADRERMDNEKMERERQAATMQIDAKPQLLTPQNV
ncbi:hypothetical protein AAFC00_005938 [Neodothiora populina]|uniref:Hpc2-related domain-containing protein n=1 Tax=Neodothiora populina TaxID=2781224 RepID=A0ABR3P7R5_9PEZI